MYEIGEAEIAAVARVIRERKLWRYSDAAGAPTETTRAEQEWAARIGVRHGLAVSTGTAALISGLVGLGIEPGAEVMVPGYTFVSTALAPLAVGAVPVLAEVDASLTLDPADVAKKLSPRTRAIIPVHMLGHLADLEPILALARPKGVKVLEDACQCDGGSYRGLRAGRHGEAGAFSFNCFKVLTAGEGGMLVTDDELVHHRARIYHDTGCAWWPGGGEAKVPYFAGVNYRMDEIRAAILRVQLERLEGILEGLRRRWRRLRELLDGAPGIEFAPVNDADGQCGATLLLRVEDRARAQAFAAAARERKLPVALPYDSGRHVYSNWEVLMQRRGAFHPALDPLLIFEAGRAQRYAPDMLPRTLEHLARTVQVNIALRWTEEELSSAASGLRECARPRNDTVKN
jgi:dTDP-4-amino-4,6-dideoxygalactose transaminase